MTKEQLQQKGRDSTARVAARPCAPCRSSCRRTCKGHQAAAADAVVRACRSLSILQPAAAAVKRQHHHHQQQQRATTHKVWLGWLGATALIAATLERFHRVRCRTLIHAASCVYIYSSSSRAAAICCCGCGNGGGNGRCLLAAAAAACRCPRCRKRC